jgi:pimeloyl-ACP methyl ester carboxylesterase
MTRSLRLRVDDGVEIATESAGAADGQAVLLLHGAGQTRQSWRRVSARLMAKGMRVISADMRGHGESDWSPDGNYRYPRLVADVEAIVRHFGGPMILVGASIGGKIAMCTAAYCDAPIASALVMIDIVPRTNIAAMDRMLGGMRPPVGGFESLDAAAQALASGSDTPFVSGSGERLRRSMRQDAQGRWHWHWDPAFMRSKEQGTDATSSLGYMEDAARRTHVPLLLARGERSEIVTDDGVAAFRAIVPQLEVATIAGAGHMLVGDQNDIFSDRIEDFIARL